MLEKSEQERRQLRLERAERFEREVATWSSRKLRLNYAQPEMVRAAEERERLEKLEKLAQYKSKQD